MNEFIERYDESQFKGNCRSCQCKPYDHEYGFVHYNDIGDVESFLCHKCLKIFISPMKKIEQPNDMIDHYFAEEHSGTIATFALFNFGRLTKMHATRKRRIERLNKIEENQK